jgi:membrane protease YdiL (CAAX protease family)
VSGPNNFVPPLESTPPFPSISPVPQTSSSADSPVWTIWDVIALAFVTVVAIIVCALGTSVLVHLRFLSAQPWTESIKRPEVIVLGQLLAYILIVVLMYKLLRFHSDAHPLISIRWNWPQNVTTYLLAGVGLAILLVPLGNLLPMPKNVPIDEFFRTARDAYILSFFGILFAPIFEELFFRGFLYPVVESWTHAVFHAPRRIRMGRNLLLLLALWGYCVQRIPARWQPYVTYGLAAVAFLLLVLRVLLQDFELLNRLILPVICFAAWTFVGYFLHGRALLEATVVPLLMAAALTGVLWQRPTPNALSLLALGSAIAITALAFASIHASQLRYSWGPVLIIFLVGIALTTVRALQKSVAATVLMHMAYNATIFVVTYIATDRFRHMEKFNQ